MAVDFPPPQDSFTLDAVFHGRVPLQQSRRGYRFGIDSVLLAHEAAARAPRAFVEIGAGCGVISLAMDHLLDGAATGTAIEVQPSLHEHLVANLTRNGAMDRIRAILGDARTVCATLPRSHADVVVMNPPYFDPGHGQINPESERARARHQLDGPLDTLVRAAARCLHPAGTLELVYPAARLTDALLALRAHGLRRVSLRPVHPFAHAPAELVLVSASARRRDEVALRPALVMHLAPGQYHPEVVAMLNGRIEPAAETP